MFGPPSVAYGKTGIRDAFAHVPRNRYASGSWDAAFMPMSAMSSTVMPRPLPLTAVVCSPLIPGFSVRSYAGERLQAPGLRIMQVGEVLRVVVAIADEHIETHESIQSFAFLDAAGHAHGQSHQQGVVQIGDAV